MARTAKVRVSEAGLTGDALDLALRSLFSALQARALPDSLRGIVDQLDRGSSPKTKLNA